MWRRARPAGAPAVARGEGFVSPGLTPRERDVLALLGRTMTNTQIARHLHIEESTAKTHVQSVLSKLGVHTRVEAALMASRAGL
ncbi:response regulator transcription factor [Streptomyces acidiscabies]|uniref:HTH luxR-type domain-containing protein n=1 Tax=Streptomyces acidiscabies TaxID=42234 RepID=A0A0L0K7A1_9ACTN|nr:LuxR C-terminal-related transcriptional regulator [Streptomyces acidiscabies]KND33515.1 hypothetical protein IQ63_19110 [Streptomyces acidiscabies]